MDLPSLIESIGENGALKRIAKFSQPAVKRVLDSRPKVRDFLRGEKWLGHALHPLLTDVTLGAYTGVFFLDITRRSDMETASDYLLTLGIGSALGTVASGAADWTATAGRARQIGVLHALTNTAALVLYGASLAARRSGKRSNGVRLSLLAYGVSTAAAYLGGHLVYSDGAGVDSKTAAGVTATMQTMTATY